MSKEIIMTFNVELTFIGKDGDEETAMDAPLDMMAKIIRKLLDADNAVVRDKKVFVLEKEETPV